MAFGFYGAFRLKLQTRKITGFRRKLCCLGSGFIFVNDYFLDFITWYKMGMSHLAIEEQQSNK